MIKTPTHSIFPVEDDPGFPRSKQNNFESFAITWTTARTGRRNGNTRIYEKSAQELANRAYLNGAVDIRIRRQWIAGFAL